MKAGWLIKEKGRWYLTDDGKKAYSTYQDPEEFNREASRLYHQWADRQPKETIGDEEESPEKIGVTETGADASSTLEEAEETAWNEIEEYLKTINPYDLQKLVAALLRDDVVGLASANRPRGSPQRRPLRIATPSGINQPTNQPTEDVHQVCPSPLRRGRMRRERERERGGEVPNDHDH